MTIHRPHRTAATPSERSSREGFLLIEALTAMAISALLLIALGSLIGLVLKASDRAGKNGDEIEETSRLISALTREIETISPQRWAGRDAGFVFEGDTGRLVFARKTDGHGSATEIHLVTLASGAGFLTRTEDKLPPTAKSTAEIAASGQATTTRTRFRVGFAFFSRLAYGQEALTDSWPQSPVMPVAIRVSLFDRQNKPRGTVRILIPVDAEPGCAAPGRGVCSLAPKAFPEEITRDALPQDQKPIDANDALGWGRYIQR